MKRGLLNAVTGLLSQVVVMIFGIYVPRLFLLHFYSEANGLVSSITQVFTYFTLLEAGVGAAALHALYAPVARGDNGAASAIVSAAGKNYKRTSLLYLGGVLVFAAVYALLVDTSISKGTIVYLVLVQGIVGVLNYAFFAHYKVLLEAEGKEYVVVGLGTFVSVATNVAKIVLINLGCNIIVVQSAYAVVSVVQMVIVALHIRRKYQWLDRKAAPNDAAISQKHSALIHQVSALVFNNTDVLILSMFCGFKVTSVYLMYSMFFGLINSAVYAIAGSANFALGQSYQTDRPFHIRMHDCYETYFMGLVFALYGVAYLFILPFMKLYTAGVTDVNYIDPYLPLLFAGMSLLSAVRIPTNMTINHAGHFKNTQTQSMVEAGINITVSLVAVQFMGMHGALLGTIVALLYRSNDILIYTNTQLLNRSPWPSYRRVICCLVVLAAVAYLSTLFPMRLDNYFVLLAWATAHLAVLGASEFAALSLMERPSLRLLIDLFRSVLVQKSREAGKSA